MKKKCLLFSMAAMLLASCTNEVEHVLDLTEQREQPSNADPVSASLMALDNIRNYIAYGKFDGADTRAFKETEILPYVVDNDTAMYIANYGNGWEIFSTDQRTPLIMVYSDTGSLDMDDENLPPALRSYIYTVANEIHQLKKIENEGNEVNSEWLVYPSSLEAMEELRGGKVTGTRDEPLPGSGYWELIYSGKVSDNIVSESPRYTSTQWNQEPYYNKYVPYSLHNNSYVLGPAGCTPVATAQYLYFLHGKYNKPATTVSTATLINATTNKYSFSNKTSGVWSQMALNLNESSSRIDKSAMLIAYVGQKINTQYSYNQAAASMATACNFISSESGISHSYANYSYTYVIDQLLNKQAAVLMSAFDASNDTIGHSFIADQIITREVTYIYQYGWVGTTSTGESANYYDENGHIVGYKIHKQELVTRDDYSYRMNWGWGGYQNNVICNPYSTDSWIAGGYNWTINRKMAKKN